MGAVLTLQALLSRSELMLKSKEALLLSGVPACKLQALLLACAAAQVCHSELYKQPAFAVLGQRWILLAAAALVPL